MSVELFIGPDRYARPDMYERASQLVHTLADASDDVYEAAKDVKDDVRELCARMDAAEVLLEDAAARVAELEQELRRRPPALATPATFCPACARSSSGRCWEHVLVVAREARP